MLKGFEGLGGIGNGSSLGRMFSRQQFAGQAYDVDATISDAKTHNVNPGILSANITGMYLKRIGSSCPSDVFVLDTYDESLVFRNGFCRLGDVSPLVPDDILSEGMVLLKDIMIEQYMDAEGSDVNHVRVTVFDEYRDIMKENREKVDASGTGKLQEEFFSRRQEMYAELKEYAGKVYSEEDDDERACDLIDEFACRQGGHDDQEFGALKDLTYGSPIGVMCVSGDYMKGVKAIYPFYSPPYSGEITYPGICGTTDSDRRASFLLTREPFVSIVYNLNEIWYMIQKSYNDPGCRAMYDMHEARKLRGCTVYPRDADGSRIKYQKWHRNFPCDRA